MSELCVVTQRSGPLTKTYTTDRFCLVSWAGEQQCRGSPALPSMWSSSAEKLAEREYCVRFTVGDASAAAEEPAVCTPDARTDTVVAIAADTMGEGAEELGKTLLKAFVFSLTQQEKLPRTILFYNGGAHLTCEGSPMLEDLKVLEAEGVEILTCGTCLNFYGLTETLRIGTVTNMYVIAEKMLNAGNVVKP